MNIPIIRNPEAISLSDAPKEAFHRNYTVATITPSFTMGMTRYVNYNSDNEIIHEGKRMVPVIFDPPVEGVELLRRIARGGKDMYSLLTNTANLWCNTGIRKPIELVGGERKYLDYDFSTINPNHFRSAMLHASMKKNDEPLNLKEVIKNGSVVEELDTVPVVNVIDDMIHVEDQDAQYVSYDKKQQDTYESSKADQYVADTFTQRSNDIMGILINIKEQAEIVSVGEGAGTCIHACNRLKRSCKGYEISNKMIEIAKNKGYNVSKGSYREAIAYYSTREDAIMFVSHVNTLAPHVLQQILVQDRYIIYESHDFFGSSTLNSPIPGVYIKGVTWRGYPLKLATMSRVPMTKLAVKTTRILLNNNSLVVRTKHYKRFLEIGRREGVTFIIDPSSDNHDGQLLESVIAQKHSYHSQGMPIEVIDEYGKFRDKPFMHVHTGLWSEEFTFYSDTKEFSPVFGGPRHVIKNLIHPCVIRLRDSMVRDNGCHYVSRPDGRYYFLSSGKYIIRGQINVKVKVS